MDEHNKSFQSTIKAKTSGPIEVKTIMIQENMQKENQKPQDEHKENPVINIPVGPFVAIKNKDTPTIIEEYKDDSNSS